MKRSALYSLLVLLALLANSPLYAQQTGDSDFKPLNDSLITLYNRGDFHGMYLLESKTLQQTDPEKGFVDYFSGLAKETGKINASSFLRQKQGHHYFEWFGEQKNERVDIVGTTPGAMDDYFVSDFVVQPNSPTTAVKTDNPLKNRLDSAVQHAATIYMSDPMAMGMSIGIWQDGKYHSYNYGETRKGNGTLPTEDNVYNIGSIAKTFVGTLLAQAVVDGKIKLDDDIRKYLPGSYPNLEYKGHPVRVVNLANHTSGLPGSAITIPAKIMDSIRQLPDSVRFIYLSKRYQSFNADSMLHNLHSFTVDTVPGTKYRYNGTAVSLIILLLEQVYHQPYEQILKQYLARHLDMHQTSSLITSASMPKFPQGYNTKGEPMPMKNMSNVSQFITSPSINSTIRDMLKYIRANVAETAPAIKLSHKVTFNDEPGSGIGLNWMMGKDNNGVPRIYHSGQTGFGFTSLCTLYPQKQMGFVILVNEMIGQGKLFDLEQEIRNNLE